MYETFDLLQKKKEESLTELKKKKLSMYVVIVFHLNTEMMSCILKDMI